MSVDTTKSSWAARAEREIRSLQDVESATVLAEGDVIREIHVLTRSSKSAKQVVRDVQTVLQARFNRSIDYRIVSVARLEAPEAVRDGNGVLPEPAPAPLPARETLSPQEKTRPAPAAEPPRASAERIRFGSVNLFVSGPRTQAQVELRWRGFPRMGSASGWSTRAGAHELVARATVAAVQEFLADEIALAVQDLEILRLGRRRAVVVSISMLVGRQEKILVGSSVIEQDAQQAVVCACLAALNRVVAALRPKEPTEYVLRPTSVT